MLELVLDPERVTPERIIPRARRLSRRAYDTLVARGVFDDGRLELLRGRLSPTTLDADLLRRTAFKQFVLIQVRK